jgi:ribonucleotide reductase alpha subunit
MEQNMQVVKRDGRYEDVAFEKVQQRIAKAAKGLHVNATKVAQGVLSRIVDGITTTELDNITANLAYSWTTTHPDYGTLAGRIAISNHQKNTPSSLLEVVECLVAVKDRRGVPASLLDPELVHIVRENAELIEGFIDYERDFNLDFFGFKTLEKAYLLRDTDRKVVERPQHMWMRVALGLWMHDLPQAFVTYDLMSQKYYTHATPTLFNAGTKRPQLSSCFLLSMNDDSIRGIYKTLEDCALISQYGGGIGLHTSNIRAKGTLIKGTGGVSNGIVPMLRVFNNTARYVDQCFAADTRVVLYDKVRDYYTKRIADIIPGDVVITSGGSEEVMEGVGKTYIPNKDSFCVPCSITKKIVHRYTGQLYQITTRLGNESPSYSTVSVTPEHPLLAIQCDATRTGKMYRTAMDADNALETMLYSGISADYYHVKDLREGDWLVHPNNHLGFKGWAMRNDYPQVGTQCFSQIIGMRVENVTDMELYDLEVDGTHDYAVEGIGFAHNGGGKRNGSFAIYLEPWHADVEEFLELKKNTGSEEERARDLFYAMWVPDLFMERVDANGDWTLFCPNEAPGLADAIGDEFKALYERYEREGLGRKTVKAQKLWFHILDSQIETGTPYLCYKDAANLKSNQQNLGTIKSSNLCVAPETLILTDKGQIQIKELAGQTVNVWNGDRWSETTVMKTGENQPLIKVVVSNSIYITDTNDVDYGLIDDSDTFSLYVGNRTIYCTPYHKFILHDGTRVEAQHLKKGMELKQWSNVYDGKEYGKIMGMIESVTDEGRIDDTYCFNEPENHAGIFNGVLTGNCTEIIEYSSPEETAVCNLASMSLPAFVRGGVFDFKQFRDVVQIVVRNLNRVIDINYYPIPEAERSNKRHRPIGLGVQGLADVFAMLGLAWESEEAATLNKRIFAHMYYAACQESVNLAAREGRYETYVGSPAWEGKFQFNLWNTHPLIDDGLDWDTLANDLCRIGMRNSLLIAPMPTASTSQILGNCECIEPYATHIFTRRTLAGEFIILNKHLVNTLLARGLWTPELKDAIIANNGSVQGLSQVPEDIQRIFKTVWEIKQKTLIDMAADRGPYICQSQSLNLFMADPDYKKLSSMHFYAWRKGLKTGIYYLRTRAVASAQKFTVEPVTQVNGPVLQPVVLETEGCLMCSS